MRSFNEFTKKNKAVFKNTTRIQRHTKRYFFKEDIFEANQLNRCVSEGKRGQYFGYNNSCLHSSKSIFHKLRSNIA